MSYNVGEIQPEVLSDASNNHVENKVTDTLPTKHGSYNDLPSSKVSELMKLSSLQTASTLSLLNVVKTILDENIEKTNASIPMRVASLLKFTMQEIEQRVSKETENSRKQNSLNKSREERYQSKMKALETLAAGTTEENKIITGQLQQIKIEKARIEEQKKIEHQDMIRLLEEKEKTYQIEKARIEEEKKVEHQDMIRLLEENEKKFQIEKAKIEEEKKAEHQDMMRLLGEKEKKYEIEKARIEEEKKVEHQDMMRLLGEEEKKYEIEKAKIEEEKKVQRQDMIRLLEEKEKKYEIEKAKIEEEKKAEHKDMIRLLEEKEKKYEIEKGRIEEEKKVERQEMIRLLEEKENKYQIEKGRIEEEKKAEHQDMIRLLAEKENKYQTENAKIEEEKNGQRQDMIRLLEEKEKKYQSEKARIEKEKKVEHEDMMRLLGEKEKKYEIEKAKIEEEKNVERQDMIRLLEEKEKTYEIEKARIEEEKKVQRQDMMRLLEEKEKKYEMEKARIEEEKKVEHQNTMRLLGEKEKKYEIQISSLKQEYKETIAKMERKRMELENRLADSIRKVKELEDLSESKCERLKKKQLGYEHFMDSHIGSIQDLRKASESIKQEMLRTKKFYFEELHHFELETTELVNAAQNYHNILEENRRLYNEVQDLKGNIRVYCRVRPFLPGQSTKKTTVDYIGENGDLVVANPLKQGKDTHRMFKFDKVFGPATTQEDVFRDIQPLIRSVVDGYNVCIFAYGQTGSGKTYTMTGPSSSSVENWGVNYRALNDLFNISQTRKSSIAYEVGVQMVEIYNEQVRDLLVNGTSQKRLGIWSSTQPNGLAVPDASMHGVKSTADVLELMNIGLKNRAMSATALNERSSRSHSVLTVHVQGTDLKTNDVMRGNLHLVDLAGSERVDRSEVTGDRLKEAQHINKSLSALGDVIFALAQKSHHVPYRNSKLTQVLQSSLGGQAKTLMFVQLNPEVESYSESVSTLKFAERVSGVELGAARTNKEGRGVRELMEQVGLLKDTISQKDQEIGRLRQLKTKSNVEKRVSSLTRYGPPPPSSRRHSLGGVHPLRRTSSEQTSRPIEKQISDLDVISDCSDKHSESGSQQSTEEFFQHSRLESRSPWADQNVNLDDDDIDLLRFEEGDDDERLSDISDSVLSLGTGNETDGSNSIVEYTLFPETPKPPPESSEKPSVSHKLPRPSQKPVLTGSSHPPLNKTSSKIPSSKKTNIGSSSAVRSSKRWL